MTAFVFTADSGADQLAIPGHGLLTGDGTAVVRNLGGSLPAPLAPLSELWIIRVDADHVKLASSSANALANVPINLTTDGTGTNILEIGIPYRRAHTYVPRVANQAGSMLRSADLNAIQDALVALHGVFTGQAQSIWSTPFVKALDGRIDRLYRDWANQKENITFTTSGTGSAGADFGPLMQGNVLQLVTAAAPDLARGRTGAVMVPPQLASCVQVLEFDVDATALAGAGPADCDFYAGIMDLGAYDNGKGSVAIFKSAASANWKILHNATAPGGSETIVDTGVACSGANVHRMRIEWAGADYDGGPFAKFYIDDELVQTAVANLPNNAAEQMYVAFDLIQTGADGATVYVSPFTWRQARRVADGRLLLLDQGGI